MLRTSPPSLSPVATLLALALLAAPSLADHRFVAETLHRRLLALPGVRRVLDGRN